MEAVVAQGKLNRSRVGILLQKRPGLYVVIFLIVIVLGGGGVLLWMHLHQSKLDSRDQKKLETELQVAENTASTQSNATIITDTTNLINGQKRGIYSIATSNLAMLYFQRATAFSNLNENSQAVPDYRMARQLDGSLERIALAGEVDARYALGQRKELIPLLQQLVTLEQQAKTPAANGMASIYQNAIQAIQNNQEASL